MSPVSVEASSTHQIPDHMVPNKVIDGDTGTIGSVGNKKVDRKQFSTR